MSPVNRRNQRSGIHHYLREIMTGTAGLNMLCMRFCPENLDRCPQCCFLISSVTEKRKRITAKASGSLTDQGQFAPDGLRLEEGSTGLYGAAALPCSAGGTRQLIEPQLPGQSPAAGEAEAERASSNRKLEGMGK